MSGHFYSLGRCGESGKREWAGGFQWLAWLHQAQVPAHVGDCWHLNLDFQPQPFSWFVWFFVFLGGGGGGIPNSHIELPQIRWVFQILFFFAGNHDYWDTNWRLNRGWLAASEAHSPNYFQSHLAVATVGVEISPHIMAGQPTDPKPHPLNVPETPEKRKAGSIRAKFHLALTWNWTKLCPIFPPISSGARWNIKIGVHDMYFHWVHPLHINSGKCRSIGVPTKKQTHKVLVMTVTVWGLNPTYVFRYHIYRCLPLPLHLPYHILFLVLYIIYIRFCFIWYCYIIISMPGKTAK